MYRDCANWKKCLREYPHILEYTKYPRIPTYTNTVDHEKKSDWKCIDIHNCVCTENKSQVSQEHMYLTENLSHLCYQERMSLNEYMMHLNNNLNDSRNQRVYHNITISHPLTPNLIIATSSALIDTGALHGSYACLLYTSPSPRD